MWPLLPKKLQATQPELTCLGYIPGDLLVSLLRYFLTCMSRIEFQSETKVFVTLKAT